MSLVWIMAHDKKRRIQHRAMAASIDQPRAAILLSSRNRGALLTCLQVAARAAFAAAPSPGTSARFMGNRPEMRRRRYVGSSFLADF